MRKINSVNKILAEELEGKLPLRVPENIWEGTEVK
jgi:hypothetical protein